MERRRSWSGGGGGGGQRSSLGGGGSAALGSWEPWSQQGLLYIGRGRPRGRGEGGKRELKKGRRGRAELLAVWAR